MKFGTAVSKLLLFYSAMTQLWLPQKKLSSAAFVLIIVFRRDADGVIDTSDKKAYDCPQHPSKTKPLTFPNAN